MTFFAAISVCIMDYILAYTVIGLGGIFKRKIRNGTVGIMLGAVFATTLRYIVHIISGAIFFGSWAEWFFTQDGFYDIGGYIMSHCSINMLPLIYSVFYNGLYMMPEIIITGLTAPAIYKMCIKSNMN